MYEFTKDCYTGISQIDEEHAHFFKLINDSLTLIKSTDEISIISKSITSELKNYAAHHFAHEEEYMKSINDPELPIQQRAHKSFMEKVAEFEKDETYTKEALNERMEFMIRWLYRHIISNDLMIGHSVHSNEFATKNIKIEFTPEYFTGIELIDEEHAVLFDIINRCNDILHDEFIADKYDAVMTVISELKDYTIKHFADEEKYMGEINYEHLEVQKNAHQAFIEKLVTIDYKELDDIDENPQEYLEGILSYLLDWLINHILKMDKQIGQSIH